MNNFTPRAGQVLALSRREAEYFHHDYVGTEHLLLGLIRLGQGVAVDILKSIGLDHAVARLEVEKRIGTGNGTKPAIKIPFTSRVKRVMAFAGKEAKMLGHVHVGTEHILLGLLRDGDGAAARMLVLRGANIEETRSKVFEAFKNNPSVANRPKPLGLFKSVRNNQRLPILILSSIACLLISVVAYFELVRH